MVVQQTLAENPFGEAVRFCTAAVTVEPTFQAGLALWVDLCIVTKRLEQGRFRCRPPLRLAEWLSSGVARRVRMACAGSPARELEGRGIRRSPQKGRHRKWRHRGSLRRTDRPAGRAKRRGHPQRRFTLHSSPAPGRAPQCPRTVAHEVAAPQPDRVFSHAECLGEARLVQQASVNNTARARSASPRSREPASAPSAARWSSVAESGDRPVIVGTCESEPQANQSDNRRSSCQMLLSSADYPSMEQLQFELEDLERTVAETGPGQMWRMTSWLNRSADPPTRHASQQRRFVTAVL